MRWRAFFFLPSDGTDQDTNAEPEDNDEYYGFNSKKAPPQIEELKPFEDDLVRMIDSIEFRHISNPFQDTLAYLLIIVFQFGSFSFCSGVKNDRHRQH